MSWSGSCSKLPGKLKTQSRRRTAPAGVAGFFFSYYYSNDAKEMLQFDLDAENETIQNYRDRIQQAEALQEYALSEELREIIRQEQDHKIDLEAALGI
ncbi:MAG: ferritin-like domain-containing protein [Candidatus Sumerlaeaceae bacterium]